MRISVLRRSFEAAALVLLAALAAGCTPTVVGTNNARQRFEATIVDPQGLVLAASSRAPLGEIDGAAQDGVNPLKDTSAIWVAWHALPCQTRPSLELSQSEDDRITIELDRGPMNASDGCDLMSARYGVRLDFEEPVEPEEIAFSIADEQKP
jgi:hypothetical protein